MGFRAAHAPLGLLLLALLTACGNPSHQLGSHQDLAFLHDRLIGSDLVHLVPDTYWEARPSDSSWLFLSSAGLICAVASTPSRALLVRFAPADEVSACSFLAAWDGNDLWSSARTAEDGWLEVAVPGEQLTPGDHLLTLQRVTYLDPPEAQQQRENVFRSVAWGLGRANQVLHPKELPRYRYLGAFIRHGLTGSGPQRMAGCLLDGPRRLLATLDVDAESTAYFTVDSLVPDGTTASFRLSMDGDETSEIVVPSGQSTPIGLQVPIPAGQHRLVLEARGDPDGLFLWGAPYLHRSWPSQKRTEAAATPVILITLDTTRRDALSPYGGPADASPVLEVFAKQAVVYDNASATAPWTLPSHASIFTGLYPLHHRAGVLQDHLTRPHTTLAELFRDRRYLTAGFAGGYLSASRWGVGQGFSLYLDPDGFESPGDRLTDAFIDLLDSHHDKPLFLFVNYFDAHAQYQAPAEQQALFQVEEHRRRLAGQGRWEQLANGDSSVWSAIISGKEEVSEEAIAYLRAAYLAEVAFVDEQLGRLFAALEQYGLFEPALIVVVADHGELLGEGGFFSHSSRLDPELTEIPMLIKWPGQHQGRRVAELVSQVDLFPTILSLLPGSSPSNDGLLLPGGPTEATARHSEVLMEEHQCRIHPLFDNMMIALHLFGLQELEHRELVWRGGSSCSERRGTSWVESPCTVPWQARLSEIVALAEQPIGEEPQEPSTLGQEDEASLRALGYVQSDP